MALFKHLARRRVADHGPHPPRVRQRVDGAGRGPATLAVLERLSRSKYKEVREDAAYNLEHGRRLDDG